MYLRIRILHYHYHRSLSFTECIHQPWWSFVSHCWKLDGAVQRGNAPPHPRHKDSGVQRRPGHTAQTLLVSKCSLVARWTQSDRGYKSHVRRRIQNSSVLERQGRDKPLSLHLLDPREPPSSKLGGFWGWYDQLIIRLSCSALHPRDVSKQRERVWVRRDDWTLPGGSLVQGSRWENIKSPSWCHLSVLCSKTI